MGSFSKPVKYVRVDVFFGILSGSSLFDDDDDFLLSFEVFVVFVFVCCCCWLKEIMDAALP